MAKEYQGQVIIESPPFKTEAQAKAWIEWVKKMLKGDFKNTHVEDHVWETQ